MEVKSTRLVDAYNELLEKSKEQRERIRELELERAHAAESRNEQTLELATRITSLEKQLGECEAELKWYSEISLDDEFVCLNGIRDSRFGAINFDDFEYLQHENGHKSEVYGKRAREYFKRKGEG